MKRESQKVVKEKNLRVLSMKKISTKVSSKTPICDRCHKKILAGQKASEIVTYLNVPSNQRLSTKWFHFQCWHDFFNECVLEMHKALTKGAMKIMSENPVMQNLIKNMGILKV